MRARHRTSKLLLRGDRVVWCDRVDRCARGVAATQTLDHVGLTITYDTSLEAVPLAQTRRDSLDKAINEMAAEAVWAPMVTRLPCLHGISTQTACGLAVRVGGWHRFTGTTIGAYLGLVPMEYSSGGSRSQGSITKTRNTHAGRLLVESGGTTVGPTAP